MLPPSMSGYAAARKSQAKLESLNYSAATSEALQAAAKNMDNQSVGGKSRIGLFSQHARSAADIPLLSTKLEADEEDEMEIFTLQK